MRVQVPVTYQKPTSEGTKPYGAGRGASMNARAIPSAILTVALALGARPGLATSFRLTDLGTLGGTVSSGSELSESGQVTGASFTAGNEARHAFVWDGTTLVDLGTLGGADSFGLAINASGQVAGLSQTAGNEARHAFLWDGTTMQDLGTLGGRVSEGRAINASGQVTGHSQTAAGATHAFLWDGTRMVDLGTLRGTTSFGIAINASGQVTGRSQTTAGAFHAFLWAGTRMQDLGTLGGRVSEGHAINAAGQVTGLSQTAAGAFHAFLWDGTTMLDLGTLGGGLGIGNDINAAGQVTGNSFTARDATIHAFLWDGGTLRDLGTLGAFNLLSSAAAINDSGQVVGFAEILSGVPHAFLWDGTAMHDLNTLIDPADPLQPFVTLQFGVDINDLGQILADGCDSRLNECHAYLVSPIAAAPDAAAQIEALLGVVLSLNLKAGIGNALDSKLQNALAALNRDQQDNRSAVGILNAFIHSVEAQRGKALTTEQADQLVSAAQDVIDEL